MGILLLTFFAILNSIKFGKPYVINKEIISNLQFYFIKNRFLLSIIPHLIAENAVRTCFQLLTGLCQMLK